MLRFDPAEHKYFLGEKELPSVTRVISSAGLVDSQWFTEQAAMRGTYLHQATVLDDKNDLDEESLHPLIQPYMAAWRKFKDESSVVFDLFEHPVHSEQWGYAGTLDRVGTLNGRSAIFDIKTGAQDRTHGLQLAAYKEALAWHTPLARFGIYLTDDGKYKVVEYKDTNDFKVFLAALTIHFWKVNT